MTGDEAAMEQLLVAAQDVTWRFSMAVCGQPDDAQDAMQEALLRTYRHVGKLRDAGAFRPWLYRTVRNACLMSRRKRVDEPSRLESLDAADDDGHTTGDGLAHPGKSPEDQAGLRHLRSHLAKSLKALPPESRAVVFLREVEGLSTRETAHALNISEDNVKARFSRARAALRAELAAIRGDTPAKAPRAIRTRAKAAAQQVLDA